jgi:hypothetical protein
MENKKNEMNMLFGVLLFLMFLTAVSAVAHADYVILFPDSVVNHAYSVDYTSNSSPSSATNEFTQTQYSSITNTTLPPNANYVLSAAQRYLVAYCNSPQQIGDCGTCDEGCGGGACSPPSCDTITNANVTMTCVGTSGYSCFGRNFGEGCQCFARLGCKLIRGSCIYTCTPGNYSCTTFGCESTTKCYSYGIQRYTFNMTTQASLQNITSMAFCWEGNYTPTNNPLSGAGAVLEWYNVTSGTWMYSQQIASQIYTYEQLSCINFSRFNMNLSDVYNALDNSSQFAMVVNHTSDGYPNIAYANFAYLNITYLTGATRVQLISPPDRSASFNRTVNFSYNVTWYQFIPSSCTLSDSVGLRISNSTPFLNGLIQNFTVTYGKDYNSITWKVQCSDLGTSPFAMASLSIHTSEINTSEFSPSGCAGDIMYFYCNYTDGNGAPVTGATVNISIWNSTHLELHTNDTSISAQDTPALTVKNDLQYNTTSNMYYAISYPNSAAPYNYNCSAYGALPGTYVPNNYPFNSSATYQYIPSASSNVTLIVNTTPNSPQNEFTNVTFSGHYTNNSGGDIHGASCQLTIGSLTFPAAPGDTPGGVHLYNVSTTQLPTGFNTWIFKCTGACLQAGINSSSYTIYYGAMPSSPALVFEDPLYSLNTSSVSHRVISAASNPDNLVTLIGSSNAGWNWVYAMVTKPIPDTPTCSDILQLDRSKILLVKNSTYIENVTNCSQVNQFAGVIFEDDACAFDPTCMFLHQPFEYGFSTPIYDKIPAYSYVLLDGTNKYVWDISRLREFYSNGYYRVSNYAPSFLMRLKGQFSASPYGVESLVKINAFPVNKTAIDYYYFNSATNSTNPAAYEIRGMPNCENSTICNDASKPHFYLDNQIALANSSGIFTHLQLYGADGLILNVGACPPFMQCNSDAVCNCSSLGHTPLGAPYRCCGGICQAPCVDISNCPDWPGYGRNCNNKATCAAYCSYSPIYD